MDPEIVEYLETPPVAARLRHLLELLRREPRALMRRKEAAYKDNGLDDEALDRQALINTRSR